MLTSPMVLIMLLSALMAVLFNCRDVHGDEWQSEKGPSDVDVETDGGKQNEVPRGREILRPGLGEFIFIEGGEFTMGHDEGEHEDQHPEHVVELSSFYVGRTPVTNAQFVKFLNEESIASDEYPYSQVTWTTPSVTADDGTWSAVRGTENDAAGGLSWELALRYCRWLSSESGRACRLPTEAEWEYVCRGKEGRMFPWGNDSSDLPLPSDVFTRVWYWRSSKKSSPHKIPVGSFPTGATPEGVCDLVGYMDEMCSDWYDPEYYAKSPRMNPQGPDEPIMARGQTLKVTRGGLEHEYSAKGISGYFRVSELYGVLPKVFLPRGWSRGKEDANINRPPKATHGRLGFRVIVELTDPERFKDETDRE